MKRSHNMINNNEAISPLIVVVFMIAVTIVLVGALMSSVTSMSPEIYFYVDKPVTTDVTLEIENGVTKTIPEIPLGKKVTWKNVHIDPNGIIQYNGKEYPFLYYEGNFQYKPSNYGWLVRNIEGQMFLDGTHISELELQEFISNQFKTSGLFNHEVVYLLKRVINNNMLSFSKEFLIINYIPTKDVNNAIKLTTSYDFSIMRRHFLIQELDNEINLKEPIYEKIEDIGFLIHETAINRI